MNAFGTVFATAATLALLLGTGLPAAGQTAGPVDAGQATAAPVASDPVVAGPAAADPVATAEDPASFVSFVLEDDSDCLLRDGKHVLVRNLHPRRTVRVWLDRYYRNAGTGDRSRSDLKPAAEGEPLGCSRIDSGLQEWRVVRALFLD